MYANSMEWTPTTVDETSPFRSPPVTSRRNVWSSYGRQLLALLWKDVYILHIKRNYIFLFFELAFPLALTAVIMYIGGISSGPSAYRGPNTYDPTDESRMYPYQFAYTRRNAETDEVHYTPSNKYTDHVVHEAFRTKRVYDEVYLKAIKGYNTTEELLANAGTRIFNIIFESDGSSVSTLHYTMRFNDLVLGRDVTLRYPDPPVNYPLYRNEETTRAIVSWLFSAHLDYFSKTKEVSFSTNRFPYPKYLEDTFSSILGFMASSMYVYGYLIFVIRFTKVIIQEKQSRIREYLRMMGLSDWIYWLSIFISGFIMVFIISSTGTIMFKSSAREHSQPVFANVDGFLLFCVLVLHGIASIFFLMFLTTFFNSAVFGTLTATVIWVLSMCVSSVFLDPVGQGRYTTISAAAKLSTAFFFPNSGLYWCMKMFSMRENLKEPTLWSDLYTPAVERDQTNLGLVMLCMLFSPVFYTLMTFYVDSVWPWQYGIPKSPFFLFQKSYWFPVVEQDTNIDMGSIRNDLFEQRQANEQKPSVVLLDISKSFGSKEVLSNISFDLCPNQISVILGHNGAGKTTTMNIMTGLYPPTSGKLFINGYDVVKNTRLARQNVGLCPQHNVLFDAMTVYEHLLFFGMLKGISRAEIQREADDLISKFELNDKRSVLSRALSGGMKRKLSMCNAIVGGSTVIIFDEPTAGMDPEVRRKVWTILQELRKNKTILLTTHYMEEADVLGDRITFLSHGNVKCSGSPLFLKKKFETGYKLSIAKSGSQDNTQEVLNLARKYTGSSASIESDLTYEYCINIGFPPLPQMIDLFKEIEARKEQLGVSSLGVSVTTMEDVFLKVGEMAEQDNQKEHGDAAFGARIEGSFPTYERVTGYKLYLNQMIGLLKKRVNSTKRQWWVPILMILLPVIMTCLYCVIEANVLGSSEQPKPTDYYLPSLYGATKGFLKSAPNSPMSKCLEAALVNNQVDVEKLNEDANITEFLLTKGNEDFKKYKHDWLVGAEYDEKRKNLNMWFTGEAYQVETASIIIAQNAMLKCLLNDESVSVKASVNPIRQSAMDPSAGESMDQILYNILFVDILGRIFIACTFSLAVTFLTSTFIIFPIQERASKAKLIQLMTGVPRSLFFLSNFIFDFAMHFICSILMLITLLIFNPGGYFTTYPDLPFGILISLMMFGWSVIPLVYNLANVLRKASTGFSIMLFVGIILGLIGGTAIAIVKLVADVPLNPAKLNRNAIESSSGFLHIFPHYSIIWALSNVRSNAAFRNSCYALTKKGAEAVMTCMAPETKALFGVCCKPCDEGVCYDRKSVFAMDDKIGIGWELLAMFLSGLFFFILFVFIESNPQRLLYYVMDRLNLGKNGTATDDFLSRNGEDSDVLDEKKEVDTLVATQNTQGLALVAHKLSKSFGKLLAVNDISFRVQSKECFGLLGVNGAGKTTTFSMLTGDLLMSNGNAYLDDINVKSNLERFQSEIGYCPQFDALIDKMSGREMLELIAHLRGVPLDKIKSVASQLINVTDIAIHADKTTESYSGGNKRKLSIAMAILGGPRVVFLDEPTAGVDPEARRKIWNTLMDIQKELGSAIILTSHSMEECEALCSRLCIMVNGSLRCIGSSQHLKSKFAQGFNVSVKLGQEHSGNAQIVDSITYDLNHLYPGQVQLLSNHQSLLTFRITATNTTWSQLFESVHQLNLKYNFEDSAVSDTTLEQIFLNFAKTQRQEEES